MNEKSRPRGIRNHNPGNLKKTADKWDGLAAVQSDPVFFVFRTAEHGIRALAVTLCNYERKRGIRTIAAMTHRYAPREDSNPTSAYARFVAERCGVAADQDVSLTTLLPLLLPAVIEMENGVQPYGPEIGRGIDMAALGKRG